METPKEFACGQVLLQLDVILRYFSQDKYVETPIADTKKFLTRRKMKQNNRGTANKEKEKKCGKWN